MTTTKNSTSLTLLTLIIGLIVARFIGHIVFPTYDDAFITYRYARNLAEGYGLVYQPGEWVLGLTCPAFGLLAALFYRIGLPLVSSILALSILADAFTVGLIWKVLVKERGRLPVVLFALFFALSPTLTRIGVGGMEMSVFVLLSLAAMALYHRGDKVAATVLAAGCYFLRPEAVLLLFIFFGLEFFANKKWQEPVWLMVVAAGVVVLPLILIHHYYGFILPQSVRAKSSEINSSVVEVARQLLIPEAFSKLMLPFALWGLVSFAREKGFQTNSFLRTVALWGGAYLTAYLAARPYVWSWYGAPIGYVQMLFAAVGVTDILRRLKFVRRERLQWAGALAGVLPICFWLLILSRMGPSKAQRFVYEPLEKWSQMQARTRPTILADDIGAIGYYSNAYIYDRAGLVWVEAARYQKLEKLVDAFAPDYLLMNAIEGKMIEMSTPQMKREYTPIARFSPTQATEMRMDPKLYSQEWLQDYILFKRKASAPRHAANRR